MFRCVIHRHHHGIRLTVINTVLGLHRHQHGITVINTVLGFKVKKCQCFSWCIPYVTPKPKHFNYFLCKIFLSTELILCTFTVWFPFPSTFALVRYWPILSSLSVSLGYFDHHSKTIRTLRKGVNWSKYFAQVNSNQRNLHTRHPVAVRTSRFRQPCIIPPKARSQSSRLSHTTHFKLAEPFGSTSCHST